MTQFLKFIRVAKEPGFYFTNQGAKGCNRTFWDQHGVKHIIKNGFETQILPTKFFAFFETNEDVSIKVDLGTCLYWAGLPKQFEKFLEKGLEITGMAEVAYAEGSCLGEFTNASLIQLLDVGQTFSNYLDFQQSSFEYEGPYL